MKWIGTIVGAVIGFRFGGLLGAIVGAILGNLLDTYLSQLFVRRLQARLRLPFLTSTFSLFAKLARADGPVSEHEIATIERFMREQLNLDEGSRAAAIGIFREAKASPYSFEDYARQFYDMFRSERQILISMIHVLFTLAVSDGPMHPNEERMVQAAARVFGISDAEYYQIKLMYSRQGGREPSDIDQCYSILGCTRNDTDQTVRAKYRKLVQDYHPDKIASKGLPGEFIAFATRKFQEIQHAYEQVMESRKHARR